MTASKPLPARPSLESLRKQAKKLARDIAAGDAGAIQRARAHLPHVGPALTLRNAQLVIAREYGYAGWNDLIAEANKRVGQGLDWCATQARRAIHDNDVERLRALLAEYPALLSWEGNGQDVGNGLLGVATGAYGDAFDANREESFTRAACAELLIDAGAVVKPSVYEGLLESRARGLLQLFQRKGLLPRTLEFLAALGDLSAVRTRLDEGADDLTAVNDAFMRACRFAHEAVAALLLDRSIALDPRLGRHVDGSLGRPAFIRYLVNERSLAFIQATPNGPWQAFLMERVVRAVQDGDLKAFVRGLQEEPWLLGDACIGFQVGLIERATMRDRGECIAALLDLDPALLRREPRAESQAIEFAFTYAKPHLIPLLTRIWPMPDDLPHAAALGDLPRVKRWFDASGAPAIGSSEAHLAWMTPQARMDLHWGASTPQHVLDTALAWSVINRHFDVANFLLEHGADINTTWNSHEPASILHHLVFEDNYDAMRYLIDRGIDMTIKDYRWRSTAQGWARYGKNDETMAQWLDDAERQRETPAR